MSVETVIRASSTTEYPDCGRRWAAKTLRREIENAGFTLRATPPSIGAAIGTGTHGAVAYSLTEKIKTGELGNMTEAEQRGIAELEEQVRDGAAWDLVSPDLSTAQIQLRRMTISYREHVGKIIKPVTVEARIRARHPSGIILSGQHDAVIAEPMTLEDLKTGKQKRANPFQYGCYSRLLRSVGRPVTAIKERFVQRVSLKKEQPAPVTVDYDVVAAEQAAESVIQRAVRDIDAFRRTGDPNSFIANPNSPMCSDVYCSAHSTRFCPLGRQK